MKQPTFNWEAEGKYSKLKQFIWEVKNVFESYTMSQTERIEIRKKWLGRKVLQFLDTLTQAEQERCNTTEGLFITLIKNSNHNIMRP